MVQFHAAGEKSWPVEVRGKWRGRTLRDILARMRPDGCGGLAARAGTADRRRGRVQSPGAPDRACGGVGDADCSRHASDLAQAGTEDDRFNPQRPVRSSRRPCHHRMLGQRPASALPRSLTLLYSTGRKRSSLNIRPDMSRIESTLQGFDRWRNGTGSPFELLVPETEWTIVGSSRLSRTYKNRQDFLDTVIGPFNARMSPSA
jgi:hypothetical protein